MQGDNFFDCENNNLTMSQVFRRMIYDDGNDNPVINIDPNGSNLEPFFNCQSRRELTNEQVLRMLTVQDANGNPVFNIATS